MQVLLLNNTFEPIKVISWQKAIVLHFKKKVEIVEEYEGMILHSQRLNIKVPAVVRLHYYVSIRKFQALRFSKENIFFRDNYTCSYCGKKFPKSQLTLDHVIPFSRGGKKTWDNIVTACTRCNNEKSDKSLDQFSKMKGKKFNKPKEPSIQNYLKFYIKVQQIPDKWKFYLPAQ